MISLLHAEEEITRCRLCGAKLSLLQRMAKQKFCSTEHQRDFEVVNDEMALARLVDTPPMAEERSAAPPAVEAPAEPPAPAAEPQPPPAAVNLFVEIQPQPGCLRSKCPAPAWVSNPAETVVALPRCKGVEAGALVPADPLPWTGRVQPLPRPGSLRIAAIAPREVTPAPLTPRRRFSGAPLGACPGPALSLPPANRCPLPDPCVPHPPALSHVRGIQPEPLRTGRRTGPPSLDAATARLRLLLGGATPVSLEQRAGLNHAWAREQALSGPLTAGPDCRIPAFEAQLLETDFPHEAATEDDPVRLAALLPLPEAVRARPWPGPASPAPGYAEPAGVAPMPVRTLPGRFCPAFVPGSTRVPRVTRRLVLAVEAADYPCAPMLDPLPCEFAMHGEEWDSLS